MGYRNEVSGKAVLAVAFGPGSKLNVQKTERNSISGGIENPTYIIGGNGGAENGAATGQWGAMLSMLPVSGVHDPFTASGSIENVLLKWDKWKTHFEVDIRPEMPVPGAVFTSPIGIIVYGGSVDPAALPGVRRFNVVTPQLLLGRLTGESAMVTLGRNIEKEFPPPEISSVANSSLVNLKADLITVSDNVTFTHEFVMDHEDPDLVTGTASKLVVDEALQKYQSDIMKHYTPKQSWLTNGAAYYPPFAYEQYLDMDTRVGLARYRIRGSDAAGAFVGKGADAQRAYDKAVSEGFAGSLADWFGANSGADGKNPWWKDVLSATGDTIGGITDFATENPGLVGTVVAGGAAASLGVDWRYLALGAGALILLK